MLQLKSKVQAGFTIIELLIVIAIIGILATLVLTNFSSAQAKGRDSVRQNNIGSVSRSLELYHTNTANYPGEELTTVLIEGIEADALTDEAGQAIDVTIQTATTVPASPYTIGDKPDATAGESQYAYMGYDCTADVVAVGETCAHYVMYSWAETETVVYQEDSLN